MVYAVQKHNELLRAVPYNGSYYTAKEDESNLAKLAGYLGEGGIEIGRNVIECRAYTRPIQAEYPLLVDPGVYIQGEVEESSSLGVPFVNNECFAEHLVSVKVCKGLKVPRKLVKYLPKTQPEVSTNFGYPCAIYDGDVVSSFPAHLPLPMFGDNTVVAWEQGIPCVYPLEQNDNDILNTFVSYGVPRIFTTIDNAKRAKLPYVETVEGLCLCFVEPLMKRDGDLLLVPNPSVVPDSRGIGVNTRTGELVTC